MITLGEVMEKTFFEKMIIFFELLASICTITGASIWGIVTYINNEEEKSESMFENSKNEEGTANIVKDSTDEMMEDATENLSVHTENNSTNINYSSNANVEDKKNMEMINVEEEVKKIRDDYNNV